MPDNIFFSIIIPVYNRENLIARALDSVINQSYRNFEIICVDDGSKDNSLNVLNNYQEKYSNIKIYPLIKNQGRCIARNHGIRKASGEWICFLDSDDAYYPNHLHELSKAIKKFPSYYAFGTLSDKKKCTKKHQILRLDDLIYTNPFDINNLCYNKKKNNILFPEEDIPISEDWYFVRALSIKSGIIKIPSVTTQIFEHENRSMNTTSIMDIVMWNENAGIKFCNTFNISKKQKQKILSHTFLLCCNMLLSNNLKKQSRQYLRKALFYKNSFKNILLYKALIKYILK